MSSVSQLPGEGQTKTLGCLCEYSLPFSIQQNFPELLSVDTFAPWPLCCIRSLDQGITVESVLQRNHNPGTIGTAEELQSPKLCALKVSKKIRAKKTPQPYDVQRYPKVEIECRVMVFSAMKSWTVNGICIFLAF